MCELGRGRLPTAPALCTCPTAPGHPHPTQRPPLSSCTAAGGGLVGDASPTCWGPSACPLPPPLIHPPTPPPLVCPPCHLTPADRLVLVEASLTWCRPCKAFPSNCAARGPRGGGRLILEHTHTHKKETKRTPPAGLLLAAAQLPLCRGAPPSGPQQLCHAGVGRRSGAAPATTRRACHHHHCACHPPPPGCTAALLQKTAAFYSNITCLKFFGNRCVGGAGCWCVGG